MADSTTTNVTLTNVLTDTERKMYEDKAQELATEIGVPKVHPVIFVHPETKERIVGYLSEPNFQTKLAIMDKSLMLGVYQAGEELARICLLKEHTDMRMYSEANACDDYRMGVVDKCLTLIGRYQDQFKKK